jgi:8-oxo-dGTP diphosphatase
MDPPAPFHHSATRRVRPTVRVGVGVVVVTAAGRIYAGIRRNSHGAGLLALPGGHLELYEAWDACARREVKEEMNLEISQVTYLHAMNGPILRDEEKHYVTIIMVARCQNDVEPENTEPQKCEGWKAYDWDELKAMVGSGQLFGSLEQLVRDEPQALLEFLGAK